MEKPAINNKSEIKRLKRLKTKSEIVPSKLDVPIFQNDDSSTASSDQGATYGQRDQEHARPRKTCRIDEDANFSSESSPNNGSKESLNPSITRFRTDFDEFKCKMRIFGESINLCNCLAEDFKNKLVYMEKRLQQLERKQVIGRSGSNYSAIIQKNKKLSSWTLKYTKKLQLCGTEEEMREVAAKICRNYLHGAWKTVETTSLEFRRISGGLSNFLYYVALPDDVGTMSDVSHVNMNGLANSESKDNRSSLLLRCNSFSMDEPRKVLLRIYGQVHGERAMDAIVTESVVFTLLSERRLGPKLFGVFSGGRIEEYLPTRPLLTKELSEPALSMKIAEKMAAIHSMNVPLAKEPSWIWKTMSRWLKTVKEERLVMHGKNDQEQKIIKQLKTIDFDKEIEWLKKYIATVDSPVTFCHNDMQEGNILLLEDEISHANTDEEPPIYVHSYESADKDNDHLHDMSTLDRHVSKATRLNKFNSEQMFERSASLMHHDSISSNISDPGEPRLVLIDFEYCAYNYRGFDIANHFQEWAYDYTNPSHPNYYENQDNTPTLEQKEIFIKEYLKHYKSNQGEEKSPTIDEINHLLHEVEAFALASHLFWCLWSIVNASKSQIPFGYWEYALSRIEVYQRLKQQVIKKESYGIPQKRKICEVDI